MNNHKLVDILLVEDNDDDIVMIQELLAEAKLLNLIQVVKDGMEAIDYLKRKGKHQNASLPGIVLLDINLPKKNGFEVLQEIKADPQLRHLPVIMLTTSSREEDVVKSYSNGACSFVSKPVGFEKFQDAAKQLSLYWALVARVPSPELIQKKSDGGSHGKE